MAPQGQEQHHEHEQPHGQRPAPTTRPAAPGSTIATNRWGPYSGAGDFASNMAVILAALFAALALALALNAAVRYVLRRSRRARRAAGGATVADPEKAAVEAPPPPPPPPALVYSAAGTKLVGAAAECAICLAEFADGDAVRVMPACGHGFHARCTFPPFHAARLALPSTEEEGGRQARGAAGEHLETGGRQAPDAPWAPEERFTSSAHGKRGPTMVASAVDDSGTASPTLVLCVAEGRTQQAFVCRIRSKAGHHRRAEQQLGGDDNH